MKASSRCWSSRRARSTAPSRSRPSSNTRSSPPRPSSYRTASGLRFPDRSLHRLGVPLGLHLLPVTHDLAGRIDQHGRSDHADRLLPVHVLLAPRAVLLHRLVRRIRQQRDLELVLRDELAMAFLTVAAAAEHDRIELAELANAGRELARLDRAAGRVVLRIEIKNDPLPGVIRQAAGLAILVFQCERGGFLSDFDHGATPSGLNMAAPDSAEAMLAAGRRDVCHRRAM